MVDFTKKIKSSDKFRLPALNFIRTGSYCLYPKGTAEYMNFWNLERDRCINGYTADDGDFISGYNYFYLNYCPINRTVNHIENGVVISELLVTFPDFWDYDYYYFLCVDEAKLQGKHLCVLKSRRKGYEQPYSEEVLTPKGFVTMGSLRVGDYVMNPNGQPVRIGDIVEQGVQEIYEVEFLDGRVVRCGANHLWATCRNGKKFYIMPTKEYAKRKLIQGSPGKEHYPYKVPALNPLRFEERSITIDPYVLGVLLGDGYICGSTISFTTDDQFIVEELSRRLPDYTIKKDQWAEYKYNIVSNTPNINLLGRQLKELGVRVKAQNKFIPEEYKFTSVENRLELVRGLMDTDGSITKGASTFVSTSERLIDDLVFILRSLGIRVHKSNKIEGKIGVEFNNGCKSNTLPHWELCITTEEDIFKLPRKLERIRKDRKYNYNGIGIKSIRATGQYEQLRCLCINNENHLYITKDFIPTHNSYKGAAMLCRNYYLIPNSKSYVYASNKQYLTDDGILTKAWDYLDFIDEHTAWGKKRSVNTQLRKRAAMSVKDEYGNQMEIGYKSEIIGVTLKDNPDVVRGKKANLILFEEAGSFKELGAAWQIARPSVETDGRAFATMIAFGTGGDEDSNFFTLRDMFYKPKGYNCLELDNIWDENVDNTKCGFFIPLYTNMDIRDEHGKRLYMDDNGNTIRHTSLEYVLSQRKEVIENATSSVAVDRYVAERCITPAEACLDFNGNIFPKKELQEQLAKIRTNKKLTNHKQVGDLVWEPDGSIKWVVKKLGDITHYPLNKDDDPTGSIVIWEHPVLDAPIGLYVGGCLTSGEKVLTNHGLKSVEKVDHNDLLINETGDLCRIKVFQRRYKQDHDIYTITPFSSYRSTTFTKEHPILTTNGFKLAEEITSKDTLVIPNRYACVNNDYIEVLNKLEGVDYESEEFWWFMGTWLGDGCTNINKKSHDIYCAFGLNLVQQAKQYDKVISNVFNRKTIVCKANGGNTRRFTHKQLCLFLDKEFSKYASSKVIPEWVKTAPKNLKKAFLLGYLDADGSVYLDRNRVRVSFTSINLELLESVLDMLFSYNIKNSIVTHQNEHTSYFNNKPYISKISYRLNVSSESIRNLFKGLLINVNSIKRNKIQNNIDNYAIKPTNNITFCDNKIHLKIKKIVKSKYTGTVYNFECDTHTFMCRNIVTHNCDPYDFDQSGTNSLGSCFIYKRFLSFENYYDVIVAEYTGRPKTAEEFYENVRKLIIYYNGRLMYENLNKGLFSYFIAKHCDYLLADLPDIINDIVLNSKVQRKKGCHMNKQIKLWAEGLIKDWLNDEKSPGHKNLHDVLSEPLLEELISYNDMGNFDRVCALFLIMIYREQLYNVVVKEKKKTNRERLLFDGPLFAQDYSYDDSYGQVDNDVYTFN